MEMRTENPAGPSKADRRQSAPPVSRHPPTMVRLPIHSLRRPSAVPEIVPAPHPTGSPPPFSQHRMHDGLEIDIGQGDKDISGGSSAVVREVESNVAPAPAYSPPRRSHSISGRQANRSSIISHGRASLHQGRVSNVDQYGRSSAPPPGVTVEMGTQDMKRMVMEDYRAVKHFMRHVKWKEVWPKVIARPMWKWYAIIAVAITLTVLVTTQHDAVVHFCAPVTRVIRSWPAGWMIPIVLLIIVSYPPLVGHEIIGILIGLVWGLGEGFAILAAGTFIGEILLWFSFKWCCTSAAAKFEKKNKLYWSLTQLIREKTFMFVLILRFSAIPGHIVTAVSASAGANYWSYLAAAFLTLPKQFTIVYLGSAFGHKEKKHVIISTVTMVTTVVVTGVAAVYIYYQMRMVMKRRELEMRHALPQHVGDLPMQEAAGTWAHVAAGPVDDGKPTILVGEHGAEGEKAFVPVLGAEEMRGLAARRPWLFTTPSTGPDGNLGTNAQLRAWSVPHHMTESEMREFMQEMDNGNATPMVRAASTSDDAPPAWGSPFSEPSSSRSSPTESRPPRDWDLLGPPALSDSVNGRTSSDAPLSETRPSPHRHSSRTTTSLDLAHSPDRRGGRELADEADRYAYARGGRRPDYNRMRGESRAALLGRPNDDASSVKSSSIQE